MTPAITVVVATRNRPEPLRRYLESLARQNLPRDAYEVVVVDDGSAALMGVSQVANAAGFVFEAARR